MSMNCVVCPFAIGVTVLLFVCSEEAWSRVWTDKSGRKVEAKFLQYENGEVRLKRTSDGRTFEIPLARLSDEDQEFIRNQATSADANSTPSTPEPLTPKPPAPEVPTLEPSLPEAAPSTPKDQESVVEAPDQSLSSDDDAAPVPRDSGPIQLAANIDVTTQSRPIIPAAEALAPPSLIRYLRSPIAYVVYGVFAVGMVSIVVMQFRRRSARQVSKGKMATIPSSRESKTIDEGEDIASLGEPSASAANLLTSETDPEFEAPIDHESPEALLVDEGEVDTQDSDGDPELELPAPFEEADDAGDLADLSIGESRADLETQDPPESAEAAPELATTIDYTPAGAAPEIDVTSVFSPKQPVDYLGLTLGNEIVGIYYLCSGQIPELQGRQQADVAATLKKFAGDNFSGSVPMKSATWDSELSWPTLYKYSQAGLETAFGDMAVREFAGADYSYADIPRHRDGEFGVSILQAYCLALRGKPPQTIIDELPSDLSQRLKDCYRDLAMKLEQGCDRQSLAQLVTELPHAAKTILTAYESVRSKALAAEDELEWGDAIQHYYQMRTLLQNDPSVPQSIGRALAKQLDLDQAQQWYEIARAIETGSQVPVLAGPGDTNSGDLDRNKAIEQLKEPGLGFTLNADEKASATGSSPKTNTRYVTADNPLPLWANASFHLQENPNWDSILTSELPEMPFRDEAADSQQWQNESLEGRRAILIAAYMRHPQAAVRIAAAESSPPFTMLGVESYLVDLLGDGDASVAAAAASAVWKREESEFCETSIKHLRDEVRGHVSNFGETRGEGLRLGKEKALAALDRIIEAAPNSHCLDNVKRMIDKHVVIKDKIQAGNPTSVKSKGTQTNGPYTYEVYEANSKQDALAFLKGKSVTEANYYIEVETPEGTFGRDVRDMYEV